MERPVLPWVYLELPRLDLLFDLDACISKSFQVILTSLGIDEVERSVTPVEALL